MPTMLEQAIAHIRAGETEKARPLLAEALRQNPRDENAWLWMTKCVTELEQKRYCLERVLKLNPQNQYALRSLSHLTKPVPPPAPPKVSQPEPVRVKPVPKPARGVDILTIAIVGVAVFLVLLFVYAWWLAR